MISCQVSLYPLGADGYGEAIQAALEDLSKSPVKMQVGPMSTLLWGEEQAVWDAVQRLFAAGSAGGRPAVLTLTVSNACAIPSDLDNR